MRAAGLLAGPVPTGYPQKWLANAARRAVAPAAIVEIAQIGVGAQALEFLEKLEEITDPHGKSYFLLPQGISGRDARRAALLTYVLNAGTDYGLPAGRVVNDFLATPYSADEVRRIMGRQHANSWSYARDVGFVHRNGGRLVATPNGILVGLGGSWVQRLFCQRAGTTWGDIFLLNTGYVADPAQPLRDIIQSRGVELDRLLHHEERHCAQWAALGYAGMLRAYGWELVRELVLRKPNRLEVDAGLSDGGYR